MVVVERAQGPNFNLIVLWRLKRGNARVQFLPYAVGAKRLQDLLDEIGHIRLPPVEKSPSLLAWATTPFT